MSMGAVRRADKRSRPSRRPLGERESGSYSGTRQRNRSDAGPRTRARRGNPNEPGEADGRSGESFLFSISGREPWNPLRGR